MPANDLRISFDQAVEGFREFLRGQDWSDAVPLAAELIAAFRTHLAAKGGGPC